MLLLQLHAVLLTACSSAVLQRPTCGLQTVAPTSATHILCLNRLVCRPQINKAFDLLHAGALCHQLPARNARHVCYSIFVCHMFDDAMQVMVRSRASLVVPNAGEALRVVLTFEDDLVQADTAK
jgi:hypothetical protein